MNYYNEGSFVAKTMEAPPSGTSTAKLPVPCEMPRC